MLKSQHRTGDFLAICFISIIVVLMGNAILKSYKTREFIRKNNCQLISTVKTGGRVWTGKFYRDEEKLTYQCSPISQKEPFQWSRLR